MILLCAAATRAGELQVAEGAVKKAAALARPAVVTVITPEARDLDLTGVVIAPGIVLTARSPLLKDRSLTSALSVRLPGKGSTLAGTLLDDDEATDTAQRVNSAINRLAAAATQPSQRHTFLEWFRVHAAMEDVARQLR